jgi:hypothetical protein
MLAITMQGDRIIIYVGNYYARGTHHYICMQLQRKGAASLYMLVITKQGGRRDARGAQIKTQK